MNQCSVYIKLMIVSANINVHIIAYVCCMWAYTVLFNFKLRKRVLARRHSVTCVLM